jgi:hypothetical protein
LNTNLAGLNKTSSSNDLPSDSVGNTSYGRRIPTTGNLLNQTQKETPVKTLLMYLTLALAGIVATTQAQETKSTKRIEQQHKQTPSMASHLAQSEKTLLGTLENGSPEMQAQAVQTIRDLEQVFPEYPFAASLEPLEKKLKDEKTDPVVRRLAALALDGLHSDAGDEVIRSVAAKCDDKGLQTLCSALLVRTIAQ